MYIVRLPEIDSEKSAEESTDEDAVLERLKQG